MKQHRPSKDMTLPSRANRREPRLPHEHDQSSDAPPPTNEDAKTVGRQAAADLQRGLVDTDRAPVVEKLEAEHFESPAKAPRKR